MGNKQDKDLTGRTSPEGVMSSHVDAFLRVKETIFKMAAYYHTAIDWRAAWVISKQLNTIRTKYLRNVIY